MLIFGPQKRRFRLAGAFSLAVFVTALWVLWGRSRAFALDDEYAPGMSTTEQDAFELTRNTNTSRILLVAALFLLPKSKHSEEIYVDWWVPRLLENVTTDLYFFVPPNVPRMETMLKRRPKHLNFYLDTNYTSPFDTPPLKGLEAAYERNHEIDPEKALHGPHLYAVWNSKAFFLDHATKVLAAQGKTYDYVFWNDAGSFREHSIYTKWPDPHRVEQVFREAAKKTGQCKKDLIFFPICDLPQPSGKSWTEAMGPYPSDAESFSEGSFFGGSPEAVEWFADTFYAYHKYWLDLGHFVGKDQNNFNTLFLLFPQRFFTVTLYDRQAPAYRVGMLPVINRHALGACGPEWFYYQFWLSNRETRDAMRSIWLTEEREPEDVRWYHQNVPCRMTRMLTMKEVLQKTYGTAWRPPKATIRSG